MRGVPFILEWGSRLAWIIGSCGILSLSFGFATATPSGRYTVQSSSHIAIDMPARMGTPVTAVQPGRVRFSGWMRGYGNLIVIQHDNQIETWYAHLSRRLVEVGESVTTETRIGLIGSTGRSTGPHLHYEIRQQGRRIYPRSFPWPLPQLGESHD